MKTGFIGLGRMGAPMAANLVRAGHEVTVYNRSAGKAQPLLEIGARRAETIADACRGDAVLTMLADDAALEQVTFGERGVLASLREGAVHVSMSTISATLAKRLAQAHAQARRRYVGAPVFGRPEAAAAAKLFVVAAGDAAAIATCGPLFAALGQKTFVVAADPAAANLVKLGGNFLIAAAIEALGEALALIDKGGVDRGVFLDVLTSSLFTAPVYKNYGALIAQHAFQPAGFAAPLGYKDMRLVQSAAQELRVPMPLGSLLHDRLLRLLALGGDELDWSAIGGLALQDAGAMTSGALGT